ncbi:tRNA methyltransferase Trm5 [Capsaspora owczarzaki ATCC 30864]|uniref:tRNA (guanine(37)-N1)-methyltransferase n=1 Tax=Capsaspora owczarzaki (strain ATCC 30864) TaxID=595528 RepID=A0A0D2VG26_CAPO3|nr:tRNA methyltransferase Trm5 [Capsaspora owczarzaki ATCC 30864]KJE88757.1 tRNA methyltransferase Trm5 [Capsaspora owczarzaki ATCC 30864]|eukprot:XP_004365218.1 tRNA methyltransferase Trm5 [Capsaspora owczarzaki ATCC 30864]
MEQPSAPSQAQAQPSDTAVLPRQRIEPPRPEPVIPMDPEWLASLQVMQPLYGKNLRPPSAVRGLVSLDNPEALAKFNVTLKVFAVVLPAAEVSTYFARLGKLHLNFPKRRNALPFPGDPQRRMIILFYAAPQDTPLVGEIPTPADEFIPQLPAGEMADSMRDLGASANLVVFGVQYTVDSWNLEEILTAVLPVDPPASFEQVGHVAHYNLRDEHLPYKTVVGQATMLKFPRLRTIVNKTHNIDNTFRFFQMELLAGDNDFNVEVKESGCIFRFDFSRVYFNSRLQQEHWRIIQGCPAPNVACDMMAGVGPFAIPIAKQKCVVYANDLNPVAFESLLVNAKANKVAHLVHASNQDGRKFVRDLAVRILASHLSGKPNPLPAFTQVMMNLPAIAVEFLDSFMGIFGEEAEAEARAQQPTSTLALGFRDVFKVLPVIHVYMFTNAENMAADAIARTSKHLRFPVDDHLVKVHDVRDVAPKKHMFCVSFRLPEQVAYANATEAASLSAVAQKRNHQESAATDADVVASSNAEDDAQNKRARLDDEQA